MLREVSLTEADRSVIVEKQGEVLGALRLSAYYPMGNASGAKHLAVWAGTQMFVVDTVAGSIQAVAWTEDIVQVYPSEPKWCVCTETGVNLLDPVTGATIRVFQHDEVIVRTWLEGQTVWVEDLFREVRAVRLSGTEPGRYEGTDGALRSRFGA